MKKIRRSILYLIVNPSRAVEIISLYKLLKGRYKYTIILAHAYKEAWYKEKQTEKIKLSTATNKSIETSYEKRQLIVNIHHGLLHSGGLTDRLKGICTLYQFAKKENITFKISFIFPFKLEKYLMPNAYDWVIDQSAISYNLCTTAIYTWENEKLSTSFFQMNKNKQQLHIDCNSPECFNNYSELFHELFKPSQLLEDKINLNIRELGGHGNYISISLRFQNLLGEFTEAKGASLGKEKCKTLIDKCLCAINQIKNLYNDTAMILITSDSNIFREMAVKAYPYIYILPEDVGHIDYADPGKSKELPAFIDMFLIANARKAYQVRSPEMYNSDFPNMAARINNVPYEIVLIK